MRWRSKHIVTFIGRKIFLFCVCIKIFVSYTLCRRVKIKFSICTGDSIMRKIAVNTCFGGFSLSDAAIEFYAVLSGTKRADIDGLNQGRTLRRDDIHLITTIEELGRDANGYAASLHITEIPDDAKWHINEYDGMEWVAEKHRIW